MKAISFLGTSDYKNTAYKFLDGKIINTLYFPYAVNVFYKPSEHYIFMTKEAKNKHNDILSALFKFNEVEIPLGKNEDHFWEIFDDILECVKDGDEVLLDFTYGFRSQPVLAIAALIYLKALRNIKIYKIIYGAFEAKENDVVPVFDLTSFIELIDWSYATHDFINYGKAKGISNLMSELQKNSHISKNTQKAKALKTSGNSLKELTKSLSIVNIKDTLKYSKKFSDDIEDLLKDINTINSTRPIALLLNEIVKRIEPISISDKEMFNKKGIEAQLSIVQWYIDTEQYQQSITLMNELFISLQCLLKSLDPIKPESRSNISENFGKRIQNLKIKNIDIDFKDETVLWNRLSEIRNEINHAGMKSSNTNTSSQISNIQEEFEKLKEYCKELIVSNADKFKQPSVF